MSSSDDKRKSWFDDDEEDEALSLKIKRAQNSALPQTKEVEQTHLRADQSEVLLQQTQALLEQTNHLYQMYFQKIERRPPIEKKSILDKNIQQIQKSIQAGINISATYKFKAQQFITQYKVYVELWERKLKELERM